MRRFVLASACSAAVLMMMGPTASAQTVDLVISIDTVAFASGVLATEPVPAELQGQTCEVTATAENQSSVHPDSNLIVASAGSSITLSDVEREPGAITTADGTLTLGTEITVTLEIGPDGVFSGGITLEVDCRPAPSPTVSPTETPSPSPTPSEPPSPTDSPSPSATATTTPTDTPSPSVQPSAITSPPTATPPAGLAFTGAARWQLVGVASLVLLAIGLGLLRTGYRRRSSPR